VSRLEQLIGNLNGRPFKIVDMPGREGERIGLWSLTLHEEEQARKGAYEFVQNVLKFSSLYLEFDEQRALNDSIICEVLSRALRDPDSSINPYCEDADELRKKLSSGEIQNLFNEYLIFAKERSVLKDVEDPVAEVERLTALVRQGFPIAASLSRFGSPSLRILLLTALDNLSQSGMTPESSVGSLPNDSAASGSGP
jgi:hypothetical protein